ncbi:hypothetical protein SAMN05421858_4267 [Haladaptatus litoreus]|uniref:Uncharacterized protein n=1 Tax=Haladaptatus litoreus TaxID=553468 RepID=A0A1N7EIE9_9EURY|nr:hypothetical protein SAMN05421858_4267 [Haladaptatus litoreus]
MSDKNYAEKCSNLLGVVDRNIRALSQYFLSDNVGECR